MKFLELGFYQSIFREMVMNKGKKLPVGTIRDWKGKKYIKTGTGWKPHRTGGGGKEFDPWASRENQAKYQKKEQARMNKDNITYEDFQKLPYKTVLIDSAFGKDGKKDSLWRVHDKNRNKIGHYDTFDEARNAAVEAAGGDKANVFHYNRDLKGDNKVSPIFEVGLEKLKEHQGKKETPKSENQKLAEELGKKADEMLNEPKEEEPRKEKYGKWEIDARKMTDPYSKKDYYLATYREMGANGEGFGFTYGGQKAESIEEAIRLQKEHIDRNPVFKPRGKTVRLLDISDEDSIKNGNVIVFPIKSATGKRLWKVEQKRYETILQTESYTEAVKAAIEEKGGDRTKIFINENLSKTGKLEGTDKYKQLQGPGKGNRTTGAQRYNNRLHEIFDRARENGAFDEPTEEQKKATQERREELEKHNKAEEARIKAEEAKKELTEKTAEPEKKTGKGWQNPLAKYKDVSPVIVARTIRDAKNIERVKTPEGKKLLIDILTTKNGVSKEDATDFVEKLAQTTDKERKIADKYVKEMESKGIFKSLAGKKKKMILRMKKGSLC